MIAPVYWEFDLVQGGAFTMYFRAMATNGGDDSFWVQVDDGAWIKFNMINAGNCNCEGILVNYWMEAECGDIGGDWEVTLDPNASGGRF